MIRFNTAYCVQVFKGAVAEGRRFVKVETSDLDDAIKIAKHRARNGRPTIVWSTGGPMMTFTPDSVRPILFDETLVRLNKMVAMATDMLATSKELDLDRLEGAERGLQTVLASLNNCGEMAFTPDNI